MSLQVKLLMLTWQYIAHTSSLQVELVLPKQICRELLYGYAEKPVQHHQYHPKHHPHPPQHAHQPQHAQQAPYLHHSSIKYVNKVEWSITDPIRSMQVINVWRFLFLKRGKPQQKDWTCITKYHNKSIAISTFTQINLSFRMIMIIYLIIWLNISCKV